MRITHIIHHIITIWATHGCQHWTSAAHRMDRKGHQTSALKTAVPTLRMYKKNHWRVPEQIVDVLNSHWFRVCKCVSKFGLCGGWFNVFRPGPAMFTKRMIPVQPCQMVQIQVVSIEYILHMVQSLVSCTPTSVFQDPTLGRAANGLLAVNLTATVSSTP